MYDFKNAISSSHIAEVGCFADFDGDVILGNYKVLYKRKKRGFSSNKKHYVKITKRFW